ncbi:MAG: ComF family protein, partial [Candidatus Methanospirareceae archaeon]
GAAMWGLNGEERRRILKAYPNYVFESISEIIDVCGEKVFLLPCNFAIHSRRLYRNCSLLERIQSENIYSMRDRRLNSDFLGLSREDRFDLRDKCSECFKRVIPEIPEIHCSVCQGVMEEEEYRMYEGRCYLCNTRRREGTLYFDKVFTIGQERGNLAYAIKAFKGVKGPSNVGLAIPLGILVANWLFEHREELEELGVDLIIPVPSSAERIREVGFDHISEILEVVQSLVDFIEIKSGVLTKNREVRLWGLNLEERVREIRGAFTIREDARDAIHGRTILILDDVLTTGATTNECARVLKENGVRKVYVLAISRHVVKTYL